MYIYREREFLRKIYMVVIHPSYSSYSICTRAHTTRPTTTQTSNKSECLPIVLSHIIATDNIAALTTFHARVFHLQHIICLYDGAL